MQGKEISVGALKFELDLWEVTVDAQRLEIHVDEMSQDEFDREKLAIEKRREEILRRGR